MESRSPDERKPEDNSPVTRLGRKLREARRTAGFGSHQSLADAMNCDRSTVTKIESGRLAPSDKMLRLWCELCHVDHELYEGLARLARAAEASPIPPWFEDFAAAQRLAHTVRTWHPVIIPGPLQTPAYAKALFIAMGLDDDRVGELAAARIDLQQIYTRPKQPVTLLAAVDEAALRRLVGSEEDMYHQLTHLADLSQQRHIGLQVVPARRACNAGHGGAFTIASLPDAPDVLLTEAAVQDVTTDQHGVLMQAHAIFDRVRLDALSRAESLELIKELAEQWKPGQ
jgi:transcriptional regulator with XRE-family HTH domain